MRFLVVFARIFRFFASRFIRFLHRQFLKLFDECDDRYASWLERSRIALIDIQKELSKAKKKEGVMKTTAESLCSEGKFGDPETAISCTKEALQARMADYKDIVKAKNNLVVDVSEIRFAFSFAYTWFLFNCPVTPPRQQSILKMTMDDWEVVRKTKVLITKNFKTSATYGAEALPLEEDVISVFDDLVNHVAVFEVLRHIFRFFSMLAFMVVRVHQLWSEYGLSAHHWKALKKFYLTVCG